MAQKYIPVPLRRGVRERAGERCEYCLIPEQLTLSAHWVDHIVAEKHGGRTEEANLALSCALCNQRKRSDRDHQAIRQRARRLGSVKQPQHVRS